MLVARRIYPEAPNHKLETLIRFNQIAIEGDFHRALFDVEMTAKLWITMRAQISEQFSDNCIPFRVMQMLAKKPKSSVATFLGSILNRH